MPTTEKESLNPTPEEWRLEVEGQRRPIYIVDVQDVLIATVHRHLDIEDTPEWAEDNARLMVNAKVMYNSIIEARIAVNEVMGALPSLEDASDEQNAVYSALWDIREDLAAAQRRVLATPTDTKGVYGV